MTNAQAAANARKPYADKIAVMVREREELISALQALVNLSAHPLFHEQTELPAWGDRILEARNAIAKVTK